MRDCRSSDGLTGKQWTVLLVVCTAGKRRKCFMNRQCIIDYNYINSRESCLLWASATVLFDGTSSDGPSVTVLPMTPDAPPLR